MIKIDINDLYKDHAKILEFTKTNFFCSNPHEIGFNGKTWDLDIQAVVVDCTVIIDRKYPISKKGMRIFNEWLRLKFNYKL